MDGKTLVAVIGLGITFLLNFGGLVWGAAKMSSAIGHLDQVTGKLTEAVEKLERTVGKIDTRVTVLEAQQDNRSERVG